jgi:hypothetical protein
MNGGRGVDLLARALVCVSSFGDFVREVRVVADVGRVGIIIVSIVGVEPFWTFVAVEGRGPVMARGDLGRCFLALSLLRLRQPRPSLLGIFSRQHISY